jgi:hypothetical protein
MQAKKVDEGIGTSPGSSLCQQPIIVNWNSDSDDFLLSTPNARAGFNSQLKILSGRMSELQNNTVTYCPADILHPE